MSATATPLSEPLVLPYEQGHQELIKASSEIDKLVEDPVGAGLEDINSMYARLRQWSDFLQERVQMAILERSKCTAEFKRLKALKEILNNKQMLDPGIQGMKSDKLREAAASENIADSILKFTYAEIQKSAADDYFNAVNSLYNHVNDKIETISNQVGVIKEGIKLEIYTKSSFSGK